MCRHTTVLYMPPKLLVFNQDGKHLETNVLVLNAIWSENYYNQALGLGLSNFLRGSVDSHRRYPWLLAEGDAPSHGRETGGGYGVTLIKPCTLHYIPPPAGRTHPYCTERNPLLRGNAEARVPNFCDGFKLYLGKISPLFSLEFWPPSPVKSQWSRLPTRPIHFLQMSFGCSSPSSWSFEGGGRGLWRI